MRDELEKEFKERCDEMKKQCDLEINTMRKQYNQQKNKMKVMEKLIQKQNRIICNQDDI